MATMAPPVMMEPEMMAAMAAAAMYQADKSALGAIGFSFVMTPFL
jgi:hypothetical protein